MSNHSTANKRNRDQNGGANESDSQPALKKRKMENQMTRILFNYEVCNMSMQRTIEELNNIPPYWNVFIENNQIQHHDIDDYKERYLRNKFHIALKKPMHSRFGEQSYLFMDRANNICLITDSYREESMTELAKQFTKAGCETTVYDNPPNNPHGIQWGSVTKFTFNAFELHRSFICIMRVPYTQYYDKYTHSFKRFLIDKWIEMNQTVAMNDIKEFGVLYMFKSFLEHHASPCLAPPEQWSWNSQKIEIDLCTTYHGLFDIYHKNRKFIYCDFIPPFLVLFELYDKPWRKRTQIGNAVRMAWKQIGVQEVASVVMEYLFVSSPAYTFKEFIQKQMQLETEDVQTEYDEELPFSGQFTEQYEWHYFKTKKKFLANPFRYNYLDCKTRKLLQDWCIRYAKKYQLISSQNRSTGRTAETNELCEYLDSYKTWEHVMMKLDRKW